MPNRSNSAAYDVSLACFSLRITRVIQPSAVCGETTEWRGNTSRLQPGPRHRQIANAVA
jgi:hypothetical protein